MGDVFVNTGKAYSPSLDITPRTNYQFTDLLTDFKSIGNRTTSEMKWRFAFALMQESSQKKKSTLKSIFNWAEKFTFKETTTGGTATQDVIAGFIWQAVQP